MSDQIVLTPLVRSPSQVSRPTLIEGAYTSNDILVSAVPRGVWYKTPELIEAAIYGELIRPGVVLSRSSVMPLELEGGSHPEVIEVDAVPSSYSVFEPRLESSTGVHLSAWTDTKVREPSLSAGAYIGFNTTIYEGEVFEPRLYYTDKISIRHRPFSEYVPYIQIGFEPVPPLVIRHSDPSGAMSASDISPGQRYYVPGTDGVLRMKSSGIAKYIPSVDAIFLGTYYSSFYVYNPSTSLTRRNVTLRLTGGTTYSVMTPSTSKTAVSESEPMLLSVTDDLLYGGDSRTSTYGNLSVSVLPAPGGKIRVFSENGTSPYLDLTQQVFQPGNMPLSIPDLGPGESYGVYLKIEAAFSPDAMIPKDYTFLNLSYTTDFGSYRTRSSYPGQSSVVGGGNIGEFLPSVYLEFSASYQAVIDSIQRSTDKIYSKYPPYFLHYEDL